MTGASPTTPQIAADVERQLRKLLPGEWKLEIDREPGEGTEPRPDMVATVVAPDGGRAVYIVEIKKDLAGQQFQRSLEQLRGYLADRPGSRPLLTSRWLSKQLRNRLIAEDVDYLDTTGNARLSVDSPGLYIEAVGAPKNPWPADKALQSLKGARTARAVRALLDFAPPYGVRALAEKAQSSGATLSRVISLLEKEGLVERSETGAVTDLDWVGTIRRWAEDYSVVASNSAFSFLAPRGVSAVKEALRSKRTGYAATGSLAAYEFEATAPARLASVYVPDATAAARELDLRESETGVNVRLLEPYDRVVFMRSVDRAGLTLVNPTQLAVDLLTGPGREPSEGEALLGWMKDNIGVWRT